MKTAPTVASLDAGREAMRTPKGLAGKETLNISPRFILVPAALETTTEVIEHTSAISDCGSSSRILMREKRKRPRMGQLS